MLLRWLMISTPKLSRTLLRHQIRPAPRPTCARVSHVFLDTEKLGVYHADSLVTEGAWRGRIRPQGDVFHQRRRQAPREADLVRAGTPLRRYRRLQPGTRVEHLPARMPDS